MSWSHDLVNSANWYVRNVFCPTGAGGGVDPSCAPGGSSTPAGIAAAHAHLVRQRRDTDRRQHEADRRVVQERRHFAAAMKQAHLEHTTARVEQQVETASARIVDRLRELGASVGDKLDLLPDEVQGLTDSMFGRPGLDPVAEQTGGFVSAAVLSSVVSYAAAKAVARLHRTHHAARTVTNATDPALRYAAAEVVRIVLEEIGHPAAGTVNAFCPTGEGGGVDPTCSPGGSSGQPSRDEYTAQAMANLQKTSRTASGQGVDTSASREKAEKVVAGLTAESAAQKATDNFRAAFARAYDVATGPAVRAEDVTALADSINTTVNAGITKEGTLLRTDDSTKFLYTDVAHLGAAREQFAREFADRLADPHADPRETAAWVEWRINLTDHAYADGVGKTSKALAAIPLIKAGLPLPDYPDDKEFFKRAPTERRVPDAAGKNYRGPDWDRFRDWYKGLVQPTSARNAFCPTGEGGGIDPTCSPHGAAKGERTRMLSTLRSTGGFTFVAGQDKYQRIGQSGYAVSPYPDRSAVFDRKVTRGDVRQFMEKNRDLLTKADHAVGAWRDPESGKTYLDVSIVTEDRDHAVSLGRQHNQISIFDFKSGNTIDTGGTGEKQAHNAARPGRDGRRDRPGFGRPVRRLDPTRTGQLRQAFARELRKRFRKLAGDVYQFVVTDDALGLADRALRLNYDPDQPRDEHGQWTGSGGGGGDVPVRTIGDIKDQIEIGHQFVHGTSDKNWKDIKSNGLIPKGSPGADTIAEEMGRPFEMGNGRGASVYLTTEPGFALQFAGMSSQRFGGKPNLIRVRIPKEEVRRLKLDEKVMDPDTGKQVQSAFRFEGKIKPEWIEGRYVEKGGKIVFTRNQAAPDGSIVLYVVLHFHDEMDRPPPTTNAPPGRFAFVSDPEKLAAFQDWLRDRFQSELLGKSDQDLWRRYVAEGFKRGAGRAFDDARKAERAATAVTRGEDFAAGGRDEFLRSSFGRPESVEKAQLLAARSFEDLRNVTSDMATRMGRVLTDGLVAGENPRQIARDLDDELDLGRNRAELIARTEIVRAHAEGQLDAFDRLGVTDLGVEVEWSTAGDDRVCPECEDMEGKTFSVAEAHGMIPLHPNCRCAFIPAGEPVMTGNRTAVVNRVRPDPLPISDALLEFSRLLADGGAL